MIDVARVALLLVLAFSGYTALAAYLGALRSRPELLISARRGAWVVLALTSLAVAILTYALLQHDYQVSYVYEHVSSTLPWGYTLAALWAGQEGSLLLWLWLLAILAVLITRQRAAWSRALEPYALAVMALVQAFFAVLLCFISKPFVLLPVRPLDGMGLNPLLENPGMIYHPPTLFLGYALYAVPFAYAMAALLSGRLGEEWVRGIRRWNLLAWAFLGLGILFGAQWAYVELGWGGYWGWDPVENASLVPWLTGTALLHSVMIQERRGLFKIWNLLLVIGTFLLCIFATFITRSGFVQSVHAFSPSTIGYFFLSFIGVILAGTLGLIVRRRGQLRTQAMLETALSREGTFLLNNLIFTGLAAAVLFGTLFPNLTQALSGTAITLDRQFYERVSRPLAMGMLVLLGVCPLLGWRRPGKLHLTLPIPIGVALTTALVLALGAGIREGLALIAFALIAFVATSVLEEIVRGVLARRKTTGEWPLLAFFNLFRKNRRRYGGYVVHLAVVILAVGITGEGLFKSERLGTVQRGQGLTIGAYEVRLEDLSSQMVNARKERHVGTLGIYRDGRRIGTLRPELNLHYVAQAGQVQTVTEVAVRSTLREDLYVAIAEIGADGNMATLHVLLNPLMAWLWIGGIGMLIGTAIAFWPEGSRVAQVAVPVSRRRAA